MQMSNRSAAKFDKLRAAAARALPHALPRAWPHACLLCGAAGCDAALCAPCMKDLPALPPVCPVCASPALDGAVCGACLRHPPQVAATLAACTYAFPLDRLVQALKYGRTLAVAVLLADAICAALSRRDNSPRPELLVPMPLSRPRQRERGFNQAAEIARVVARRTGIPLCHALARPVDRPAQAGLPWRERHRNVRGAFACTTPVTGRHLALVDDVMTTGATIEAAAGALRAAGAARVDAWVVARALPPESAH